MKVTLLGHTQLNSLNQDMYNYIQNDSVCDFNTSSGQVIALAAIRQCYSHKTAIEVLETESEKYFGEQGKEGTRLFNQIVKSGHTSTLEHIHFTFAIEGVSRALLAQLTRHRQLSFSVQSQRYNKFSSDSRSGGFDAVVPATIAGNVTEDDKRYTDEIGISYTAQDVFEQAMEWAQESYNALIACGVSQEDARAVLPNAATCNLVTSGNLRAWLEFHNKRKAGAGAQHEIAMLAEHIKNAIIEVEPWTSDFFG